MDGPSPARLYATLTGVALTALGIVGFFYTASFGSPGEVEKALGVFAVNGWANVLHIAAGAIGLLLAGFAPRGYALRLGGVLVILAFWGFALGGDDAILGFLPADTADNVLRLVLGALGLAAAATTPRRPVREGEGAPRPRAAGQTG